MFSALAYPNFQTFLVSMLIAYLPMQMQQVVQGYLAFTMTHSAAAVGLVQTTWGAPQLLLTLFAAVVADRFDRKLTIGIIQTVLGALGIFRAILLFT